MTESYRAGSPRLDPIEPNQLSDAQRSLVAAVEQGPRAQKHGRIGMAGPFGVWLRAPEVSDAAQRFGVAVRFTTSLPEQVKEIAILTVGAYYRARFEFFAHAALARAAGVDDGVIEALRTGATPAFAGARERAAHELTTALLMRHAWTDTEYDLARQQFSEQERVELVTVIGYYCQISLTLNAFCVPLPEGADDPFPESAP
ncbi:MAG: carboxymuconolactone decarboxylase family protein [Pseudomonadales bacterium]